jgi:hypothetical protein
VGTRLSVFVLRFVTTKKSDNNRYSQEQKIASKRNDGALISRVQFQGVYFNHMIGMVTHLGFPEPGDTQVTLAVDIREIPGEQGSSLGIDNLVNPFTIRKTLLEMDEGRIGIQGLEQGKSTDL